jgi:hypothetical protein
MDPVHIVGFILIAVMLLGGFIAMNHAQEQLDDPDNTSVIYLEQLPTVARRTGNALWLVSIYRQSGNVHSEREVNGDASEAIKTAMATFRRAKIDAVGVLENGDNRLRFGRLYHNHRGSNEGKKVGSAHMRVG